MRLRVAQIGLCLLLTSLASVSAHVQNSDDRPLAPIVCMGTSPHEDPPSGPEVSIIEVTFSGFIQMSVAEQNEIVNSVKQQKYAAAPVDEVVEEAIERVRAGWQNHGYFQVQVNAEGKILTKSETEIRIALFAQVEEGAQYRLGGIAFKNNKVLSDSARLRDLFPIKDGDVFSREKIAEGLESLRKAYGEYGYVNYTGVPSTTFDEEKKLAYLEVVVDEGKRFVIASTEVKGFDRVAGEKLLKDLAVKPGNVFNSRLWDSFVTKIPPLLPGCGCADFQALHLDEQMGTVQIVLDFGPCSAN